MSRPCPTHPTAPTKGAAYARCHDGSLHRLTRHQILSGNLPPDTVDVLTGITDHLTRHDAATSRSVTRLTPQEASAAIRERARGRDLIKHQESGRATLMVEEFDGQVRYDCDAVIHDIDGQKIVFGSPAGVEWGEGVVTMSRNPVTLTGADIATDAGKRAVREYATAIAAVNVSSCSQCGTRFNCPACQVHPMREHRLQVVGLLGPGDGQQIDSTVVDALALKGSRGDAAARAELKALAAIGEQMVATERAKWFTQHVDADERTRLDAMNDTEFREWYDSSRERLELGPLRDIEGREEQLRAAYGSGEIDYETFQARITRLSFQRQEINEAAKELTWLRDARSTSRTPMTTRDLYLVHETKHDVTYDENGDALLWPLEDHLPEYRRTSIHFSLNGLVSANMGRPSSEGGRAIIVSLADVQDTNPGALSNLYAIDTYLSPPPGQPLRLPAGAVHVVDYDRIPQGNENAQARADAVNQYLIDKGAPRFLMQSHYSSAGVDSRVALIARELGATSQIHSGSVPDMYENMMLGQAQRHRGQQMPRTLIDPSMIARAGENELLRMVAHDLWSGTRIEQHHEPSEHLFG